MGTILEGDGVHCLIFGPHTNIDFSMVACLKWPKHDSCCQVDHISKNRKFLPTSRCANDPWEYISGSNTHIAPCSLYLIESPLHVHSSQNGSLWIINMCYGAKTPYANQCTAFIVHDKLVQRAFKSVNLLLYSGHDLLDFVHSWLWTSWGKVDTQGSKHHSQSSRFRAKLFIPYF